MFSLRWLLFYCYFSLLLFSLDINALDILRTHLTYTCPSCSQHTCGVTIFQKLILIRGCISMTLQFEHKIAQATDNLKKANWVVQLYLNSCAVDLNPIYSNILSAFRRTANINREVLYGLRAHNVYKVLLCKWSRSDFRPVKSLPRHPHQGHLPPDTCKCCPCRLCHT